MERDRTGEAVQEAARLMLAARQRIRELVPLGPGMVRLTKPELRRRAEDPFFLERLIQTSGVDGALQLLSSLRPKSPPTLDSFINRE